MERPAAAGALVTPRPERRRSPRPPSRQEVEAARDELFGVVRVAMAAELEWVMPSPWPLSESARTPPAETVRRHDAPLAAFRGRRSGAMARSSVPPRERPGRSRPGTRRPSRHRRRLGRHLGAC